MAFEKNWFRNSNRKAWLKHLGHLASEPIRYLEIGVLEGKSLCWAMQNILKHPESEAIGIDLWEGEVEGWPGKRGEDLEAVARDNVAKYGERVELICGSSVEVLTRSLVLETFDLIYIDGSHEPLDTMVDSCLCWKKLDPGGYCIWDDYHGRPAEAIRAFHRLIAGQYEEVFQAAQNFCARKV